MIYDSMSRWNTYFPSLEIWEKARKFIEDLKPGKEDRKYEISGQDAFARVADYETRLAADGVIEAHRYYVDVQLLLEGEEEVHVFNTSELKSDIAYDKLRDVEFFQKRDKFANAIQLMPGNFLILFPEDAHMPGIAVNDNKCMVKKLIIKVRRELLG